MRVCRLCAGPLPEIVRDDALYCSASCKLKAQRKRKKERATSSEAKSANDGEGSLFELVAPLGDGPQLWLPFMRRGIGDGRQFSFAFVQAEPDGKEPPAPSENNEATATPAETAAQPERKGWAASLLAKLKGDTTEQAGSKTKASPRQRKRGNGLDIV